MFTNQENRFNVEFDSTCYWIELGQHYTWNRITIRIDVLIFQLSKINGKTKLVANIRLVNFAQCNLKFCQIAKLANIIR